MKEEIVLKRKLKFMVVMFCCTLVLLGSVVDVSAKTVVSGNELKYIGEGYTEEGIHYRIYETVEDESGVMPCIVVSKKKSISIAYEGYIDPPKTFYYSQKESDYNIVMSGTLNLTGYSYDIWPYINGSTKANYSGTIFGNL